MTIVKTRRNLVLVPGVSFLVHCYPNPFCYRNPFYNPNAVVEDMCPNHTCYDRPLTQQQVNYQWSIQQRCYCSGQRKAGDFEELERIKKQHLKCMNIYHQFRFSSTPFGTCYR